MKKARIGFYHKLEGLPMRKPMEVESEAILILLLPIPIGYMEGFFLRRPYGYQCPYPVFTSPRRDDRNSPSTRGVALECVLPPSISRGDTRDVDKKSGLASPIGSPSHSGTLISAGSLRYLSNLENPKALVPAILEANSKPQSQLGRFQGHYYDGSICV